MRKPGQHGLTSGMVTAAAVQAFNATLAFSGGAGAVLRQERLEAAPLENTTKTWLPPPAGYPQGQCMVLVSEGEVCLAAACGCISSPATWLSLAFPGITMSLSPRPTLTPPHNAAKQQCQGGRGPRLPGRFRGGLLRRLRPGARVRRLDLLRGAGRVSPEPSAATAGCLFCCRVCASCAATASCCC